MQSNGVKSSGVYSVEGTLTAEQYKALQKWIKDNFEGSENAGSTMILDRNAKFLNTQMSGVDAQLLESRRFQIEEICRFFRVMPIMVGYSDKAMTYASSEQMFLAHVVHTLMPWYARLEQSIDANLLTPAERAAGYYSDFVEEGLLRGDMKTTSDVLVRYSTNGIMTRNEARAKLDMNPIDGLDAPLTPVNLMGDNTQTGDADAAQNA
jgi:HK97 family phage portal protein